MEVNNQLTENMTGACWNRYAAGKPTQGYDVTIADKQREDEQTVDGQHDKITLVKIGGRHAGGEIGEEQPSVGDPASTHNTCTKILQAHTNACTENTNSSRVSR